MNDYDIYLRHATVRGGEWVGFALAWKGLARVGGLPARPHRNWLPWIPDPAYPNDPTLGSWGTWQWRFEVAFLDGLAGLSGVPSDDGRSAADMRADMRAFMPLASFDLKDLDGGVHQVLMTGYSEQAIEPFDLGHPNGGFVAQVEFAKA
jgi:hypothetical protein